MTRILPLVLLACAPADSSIEPDTDSGEDTGWQHTGIVPTELSHAVDIQPIWTESCAPCHIRYSHGSLSLVEAYGEIVGVPSNDLPTMKLVEPGVLKGSYLWHKLEGTHDDVGGEGNQMPKEDVTISPADRESVRAWIAGGAPP